MTTDNNAAKAYFTKINELRKDVQSLDWKEDGFVPMSGNSGYYYLSMDKIKRTLAPLMSKHGLDMRFKFHDLKKEEGVRNFTQHWTVILDVALVDVDTGYCEWESAYGEGGDAGDKGIPKAQTSAFKQWLTNKFLLVDGIDCDSVVSQTSTGYTKRTEEETEEIKSRILSNGVAPTKKEEEPKKEEKIPKAPKEQSKEQPKEETGNKPAQTTFGGQRPITKPQTNAIEEIGKRWKGMLANGEISQEEYDLFLSDVADIGGAVDAVRFIKKYKVI